MVEIMERRQEVEWSPDMELEGLDAEKAAALLLAVAPRCRSQSSDGGGQEGNDASNSVNGSSSPADLNPNNNHQSNHMNNSIVGLGAGVHISSPSRATSSSQAPPSGSSFPHSKRQDQAAAVGLTISSHSSGHGGVIGVGSSSLSPATFRYPCNGTVSEAGGGVTGGSGVGLQAEMGNGWALNGNGGRDGVNGANGMGGISRLSSNSKMGPERGIRSYHTGHPGGRVPSRSLVTAAASAAVAASAAGEPSPRRAPSGGSPGSMLLSLAEFATKELLTMGDEPPWNDHHSGASSRPTPPPAIGSPKRHQSTRASSPAVIVPAARTHGHHLRDRSAISRNRSGSSCRDDDDDDSDDGKRRSNVAYSLRARVRGGGVEDGDGGDGFQRRRSRPRSISMPEGMELHATRAWRGGGQSTRMMRNDSRIEAIKEELDGHDGAPSTRSRAWRCGGSGGGVSASSYGSSGDLGMMGGGGGTEDIFGSVEDAQALIRLGRQRGRWNGVGIEGGGRAGGGVVVGGEVESWRAGGITEEGSPSSSPGGGVEGEEGVCVSLPHMLAKYADMYNKNGRIGIYTRQEREAIIARFKRKRGRRVWKKKIRYNCRKNLADKRLRIKGRFVKMSPEQRNALKLKQKALRAAGAGRAGGTASRTDSSTSAGSMDMDLATSVADEISSSAGSGSGVTGEGFEDVEDDMEAVVGVEADGDDDDQEDEEEEEEEDEEEQEEAQENPQEPPKRVRRHSIAY